MDRAAQIQTCYKKYSISVDVLQTVFTQVQSVLDSVTHASSLDGITNQISTLTESQNNLLRRQSCLNTMHEQVAAIESLTLAVADFDVENTTRRYVYRRDTMISMQRGFNCTQ